LWVGIVGGACIADPKKLLYIKRVILSEVEGFSRNTVIPSIARNPVVF
jgi:hypothetical protein